MFSFRIVLYVVAFHLMGSLAQFRNYEVYSVDNGYGVPYTHRYSSGYMFSQGDRYQRNPSANYLAQSYETQLQTGYTPSTPTTSSCESFWSYQTDFSGETFGLITISSPDYSKIVLRAIFSVAARLPTVSLST